MPIFELDDNGKTYELDAPDQATAIAAFNNARASLGSLGSSTPPAPPPAAAEGDGMYMNATAGLNSALYNTLGAPVDAATWATNKALQGINALTGGDLPMARNDLPGSSRSLASAFNMAGVAKPEDVAAGSTEERIARGLGEGVGYTVGPQAAVGGLARAGAGSLVPRTMDALSMMTGQTPSAAGTLANAVAGGAAGAGAAYGGEVAPEPWQGVAGLGGGLAGGLVGALATSVPSLARTGGRIAGEYLDPLTAAGRERAAARELREAATDPSAARQALATAPDELVPGSQSTTFQTTGDMGLGGLERRMQTKFPEDFNQRRADQNSARLGVLDAIQPQGHPEAVSKAFRDRLAQIDAETEGALTAATEAARARGQGLGGNVMPEAAGDALRGSLRAAEEIARGNERALWAAVDPENRLDVPTGNASAAAKRIAAGMPKTAAPMAGEEADIFNVVRNLPEQHRLAEASALRSRIGTAMRTELRDNGQSPAYARLAQLKAAVHDDLAGVVAQRAAQEQQAVASGAMSEEQTILANLRRSQQEWEARRGGAEAQARGVAGGGGGAPVPGGQGGIFATLGAQGQGGRGFSAAPGGQGLSGDAGRGAGLPFDDAARERLAAATAATRARAETFNRGNNARITRRTGQGGPYEMGSASVAGSIFRPGSASADRIAEYRAAVGDGEALNVLHDYAASQLRRAAERPDGTLDPARVASWRRTHADALRAFPELDQRFADAARASGAIAEAAAARKAQMDAYQKGVVGRLIGVTDPADVTRMVGGLFSRQDGNAAMQALAAEAGRSGPNARDGLRKAVADYIAGRFVGNTEAATTGQGVVKSDGFQTFVRRNRRTLSHVFKPHEIESLDRLAADIQRSNRSLNAVRIPGQSNTAQDTLALKDSDTSGTVLAKILGSVAAGATAGGASFGVVGGVVGGVAAPALAMLRQAGVRKTDDLVRAAMLDPQLARLLLAKPAPENVEPTLKLIAQRYRAATTAGFASDQGGGHDR